MLLDVGAAGQRERTTKDEKAGGVEQNNRVSSLSQSAGVAKECQACVILISDDHCRFPCVVSDWDMKCLLVLLVCSCFAECLLLT